jgi:hypothetical protein
MRIRFTRGRGKPDTLTCLRDDGTSTWCRLHPGFGAEHDLAHYAIETTLGYQQAFFGLIASGRTIESFEEKNERNRAAYPLEPEAGWAEYLAGALQASRASDVPFDAATVLEHMKTHVESRMQKGASMFTATRSGGPFPYPEDLTDERLNAVRILWENLLDRWYAVPPDGHLELEF